MSESESQIDQGRALLADAQRQGLGATLVAFVRLSGPGWLQSAITLGGGSLAGALFLGILGNTSLLWLQLMAIIMGVVMLSAISYVTLSTGERPFRAINRHINPALGWGWLIATIMANIIWCMPQYSLCFAAIQKNLASSVITDSDLAKFTVSVLILVAALFALYLNGRQGRAAKAFDLFLKALVGLIVICFVAVVALLASKGQLNWSQIAAGFMPNPSSWFRPAGELGPLLEQVPESMQDYWRVAILKEQRAVMIGAAATAVGINMTFLMPYTLLNRGWDKTFRGLARFDLSTGMAVPYLAVTSCVVIAAAATFHTKVDDALLSENPSTFVESADFKGGADKVLAKRVEHEVGGIAFDSMDHDTRVRRMAALPAAEKRIAASLVHRNAFHLSKALEPLLGEQRANLVFGIGVFGMGFSTIIILMLINGFAFCEMFDAPLGGTPFTVGCLVAGLSGAAWPRVWAGEAGFWLPILASSFGMMLLPIAYVTFFVMMNSRAVMGDERPNGISLGIWNALMGISVLGAIIASVAAIGEKISDKRAGPVVIGMASVYVVLVLLGFLFRRTDGVKSDANSD
ncbi:MAG: divalent metal cation transporter [Pirellulaceae bacterium]